LSSSFRGTSSAFYFSFSLALLAHFLGARANGCILSSLKGRQCSLGSRVSLLLILFILLYFLFSFFLLINASCVYASMSQHNFSRAAALSTKPRKQYSKCLEGRTQLFLPNNVSYKDRDIRETPLGIEESFNVIVQCSWNYNIYMKASHVYIIR